MQGKALRTLLVRCAKQSRTTKAFGGGGVFVVLPLPEVSQVVIRADFRLYKGRNSHHITGVMWGGDLELGEWRKVSEFWLVVVGSSPTAP